MKNQIPEILTAIIIFLMLFWGAMFSLLTSGCDSSEYQSQHVISGGCTDNFYDESSGLCWQKNPPSDPMTLDRAILYCANGLDGNWRIPTIDELRTLIRVQSWNDGTCKENLPDGDCQITDENVNPEYSDDCGLCEPMEGPAGCYWPSELSGSCGDHIYYWSDSVHYVDNGGAYLSEYAWSVDFAWGRVDDPAAGELNKHRVRCVR